MRRPTDSERGMRTLRTLSDLKETGPSPHRVYMRVSVLEMEKRRHQQERDKAQLRIEAIGQRIAEIEGEVSRLLGGIETGADAALRPTASPPSAASLSNPTNPTNTTTQAASESPPGDKLVITY